MWLQSISTKAKPFISNPLSVYRHPTDRENIGVPIVPHYCAGYISPRKKKFLSLMAFKKKLKCKPLFVAVVGCSGSGKSWLADRLQEELGKEAARLSLDSFYLDRSHLKAARRTRINFDHPRAIDWKALESFLKVCARGKPARLPQYDFATHSRRVDRPLFSPKRIIVMDGLWLLRRPSVRKIFTLKVYLDCSPVICLRRRLARDCAERGRDPVSVKAQFLETVVPMQQRYVISQQRWAQLVLDHPANAGDVERLARQIQNILTQN
jgi:uridine kinase